MNTESGDLTLFAGASTSPQGKRRDFSRLVMSKEYFELATPSA